MRALDGHEYSVTDNERTVSIDDVTGYCGPQPGDRRRPPRRHHVRAADPDTKGGSEATVRVANADPVPSDANLPDEGQAGNGVCYFTRLEPPTDRVEEIGRAHV